MAAIKRKQESGSADRKKAKVDSKKSAAKKAAPPKKAAPVVEESSDDDDEMVDADVLDASDDDDEYPSGDNDGDDAEEDDDESGDDTEMKNASAGGDEEKSEAEIQKQRAARAEQKRMIAERKNAKPLGEIIQKSKKVWEQMRRKDLKPEERKKKIDEHQEMIRGNIKELVFKHDASRVVQTALKYGSKAVREEVATELKGTYLKLSQSSYGKYMVVKAMHYGSPETKKMIVDEFCGNVKKLIKHREASFVIEDCFREFATPEQKARLVREFYGAEFTVFSDDDDADASLKKILEKSPEKRAVIMKNMFEILTSVVEKGAVFFTIIHRIMLEFISNTAPGTTDATEFIELVKEHVGEIAFSKDGSQVVMRCLALGNAKDRKVMIKALKPVADQLAAHESGHTVLLTLFDVVDDTVLVNKSIFTQLQENMLDLACHKFGRIPLLYPFVGRKTRLIPPPTIAAIAAMDPIREATSKKDADLRQSELRVHLSPLVLQGVTDNAADLIHDSFGCQFITEVLLGATGDKSSALTALASLASGDPTAADHVASTAAGGRMLKALVAGGHYNNKLKAVEPVSPPLGFADVLFGEIAPKIGAWATGAGSFVVVALLETEAGFARSDDLKKALRKVKKDIEAAAEAGNKGSNVVLSKL